MKTLTINLYEQDLKKWLKECKAAKNKLHLERLKVLNDSITRLKIDIQLKDIDSIINKINYILKKGD